ncbi:outer membrane protein assembly factor BamD [Gammaproteobacteria bacterium]|nr:outer membrane protein assembly factor BamD [Gammaproteobacteria bacterium]MDC0420614.1 outer membrane protein assembly factor BamD [Gammaproteobacteria bacterium]MDC1171164.1 outer membrane protein assembly factor BamD [Gammaproteobacteria bacterium]
MIHKLNLKLFSCLSIVAFFIVSCNSDGPEIEQPEKIYYDQAQRRIASNNYFGAIESLEAIETRYPFGKYAEQAQVELIYVYFMNSENDASHAAAEKFIRLHPRHPNIDYAYFMKGLSSYTRDNSLMQRLTETDLSNRDVSGAKQSFSELTEFLTRHPDSQYAPYAKQRNIYLRNMIARNELAAADYYLSIDAHVAAIRRAKYVIENIPNSSENFRALKILEKSYKALGYIELYDDVIRVIDLNYSDKNIRELSDSNWSWNFLRSSKPEVKD